jgi:hypothetical protein
MVTHRTSGTAREADGKNLQGDLLSGEWTAKPPRRGDGSHVRLKPLDGEKAVVPGMASYAGEGPPGRHCRDCDHFGEVIVQTGADAVEMNRASGCVLYSKRMGHAAPTGRRTISLCRACKHFSEADGASPRRFVVDHTGLIHRFEDFPADLRKWRPRKRDGG